MFKELENYIREIYSNEGLIPLHEPCFCGKEKEYVLSTIDSTFVSSVGEYVDKFEKKITEYTGSKYAIAVVNGTSALHMSLLLNGVESEDEVLTQAFSFVATVNAIKYCGANPVFIDIDADTLGLSPEKLEHFLVNNTNMNSAGECINKTTGKRIKACVPVHIYGHCVDIDKIIEICSRYNIDVIEDAAESLGSTYKGKHTGTFGKLAALSFNGNKIITTGGGGMVLTQDEVLAKKIKHLTTTAKIPGSYFYLHDEVGYNYRMPNLNAALGLAQMENFEKIIEKKRSLADKYIKFFKKTDYEFFKERKNSYSNYWLNTLFLKNKQEQQEFLEYFNSRRIIVRPAWTPLSEFPMYQSCEHDGLDVTYKFANLAVNIPSGVKL